MSDSIDPWKVLIDLMTDRFDGIDDQMSRLEGKHDKLVEATNHKIDALQKRGITALGILIVVSTPVIIFNWQELVERAAGLF